MKFDFLKKIKTQTGNTLLFKMHAHNSTHHAIHVNCVLKVDRAG